MNVAFRCPHCDRTSEVKLVANAREMACSRCNAAWLIPEGTTAEGKLWRCFICPSTELFIRKDFSQSLGIAIVVAGIVLSSAFWAYRMPFWTYAVLFTTAAIDVVLYFTVGNLLQCYRCQAQYRDLPGLENHAGFDLETHEKHRQQKVRLAQETKAAS